MSDKDTGEQYKQFLRENAKAVNSWPEWMRAGARGQSIIEPTHAKGQQSEPSAIRCKPAKVTRSGFLDCISAALAVPIVRLARPKRSALVLDVHDAQFTPGSRVWVNGHELSDRCYRAELFDDGSGVAYCYAKDGGEFQLTSDRRDVVREEVRGRMTVEAVYRP
jgi:hypothetical protein